jgi:hypothetical protein
MHRTSREWNEVEETLDCASSDWNDNGKRVFRGLIIALGFSICIYFAIAVFWTLLRHFLS